MKLSIETKIMTNISEAAFISRLQTLDNLDRDKISYKALSLEQIENLAEKINLLPFDYQDILIFRYCFGNTDREIDKILETGNTREKLLYLQDLLSKTINLDDGWIDEASFAESCKLVLEMNRIENQERLLQPPIYSNSFRRKLKEIYIPKKSSRIFTEVVKRVAVILVACILGFSTFLTINAEARERFFDWIIETFPKFSIIIPQESNKDNGSANLKSLTITYIPEGFSLGEVHEGRTMLIYDYSSDDDLTLDISFFAPSETRQSYYDTENAELERFVFKESDAIIWRTNVMTNLVWYQDGIECHISTHLGKGEAIKIAENIQK